MPPPILSAVERRILGVLVEKSKTTPDAYPMSVNAIVNGSNQKSNRDPVLSLTDLDVEEGLTSLQQKGLATRLQGAGRVERWRHNMYEVLQVNKVEAAVVTELLLRGAQTEGELRGRASRMEPIDDLEGLRQILEPLLERGLVVMLGPEGRRGTQITHGFHSSQELAAARANVRPDEAAPAPSAPATQQLPGARALPAEPAQIRQEMAALKGQVEQLQAALQTLTEEVRGLKQALGA